MSTFVGVAISGQAGSGKSTLARAILALRPDWRAGSFAAALKQDLASIGVNKGDPGFRAIAQAYGTDFARVKWGDDYWVQRLVEEQGGLAGLVIDDMRFPNELDVCKSAGLFTVRVDTPRELRALRLGYECPEHPSEVPPPGCHLVVAGHSSTPLELAQYVLSAARIPAFKPEDVPA